MPRLKHGIKNADTDQHHLEPKGEPIMINNSTDPTPRSDVQKTNVTLSRKDVRQFKRLMLDWEDEYEFPIELKESHCMNAAVKLIIRSAKPELVKDRAAQRGIDDPEKIDELVNSYAWFLEEFIEMLAEVVVSRVEVDKRRAPKFDH